MNDLQVNVTALESSYSTERYRLVEPNGEPVAGFDGLDRFVKGTTFQQRPAAIRAAERSGCGVFDMQDRKLVQQPDAERRIGQIEDNIEAAHKRIEHDEELLVGIKAAAAAERIREAS